MIRWIYCCVILIITSLNAGEIITTSDFSCIEAEVNKLKEGSLVLFDVDYTLIAPDDEILKPERNDLFKSLIAGYLDRDLFRDIRLKASHSLVDVRSLALIQQLKEKKIPVLAFTAAPAKIRSIEEPADWRINELKEHGFDFSSSFSNNDLLILPKADNQRHFPMFKSGVLFSSFHLKGDILSLFLKTIGLAPKKVIFVDDEFVHVQSVVTVLENEGIECVGIHYTAAYEACSELNPEEALYQVEYFIKQGIWLSDKESHALMQSLQNFD